MRQASQLFSEHQQAQIERAVAHAEQNTSAEIVPVVATSSGRYDRPEDIVGLWCGLLGLWIAWWFYPVDVSEPGEWGLSAGNFELPALMAAVVVGFVVGAVVGARVGWLRRLFTPRRQMQEEVAARARQLFFDNSIHRTAGGTGLLIYVSLFERQAAVLGDETICEELGEDMLDELCRQLTDGLRSTNPTEALCTVIQNAGEFVGAVLPREDGDVDELPNALVLIDE